jgi:nondiscriminating glutamyl-tRNA synthetase
MNELENAFSIERVSKSGGVFDTEKLNWVNQHYIKDADDAYLTDLAIPFLVEAGFIKEDEAESKYDFLKGMVSVLKEKLQYVKEITDHANIFFGETVTLEDEECREFLNLEHIPTLIDALQTKIENADVVDETFVKAMFKEIQKEHGIKGKNLFMGSRIVLTGQMHGPDLPKTMEVLGKETCLNRISYVKENIL